MNMLRPRHLLDHMFKFPDLILTSMKLARQSLDFLLKTLRLTELGLNVDVRGSPPFLRVGKWQASVIIWIIKRSSPLLRVLH